MSARAAPVLIILPRGDRKEQGTTAAPVTTDPPQPQNSELTKRMDPGDMAERLAGGLMNGVDAATKSAMDAVHSQLYPPVYPSVELAREIPPYLRPNFEGEERKGKVPTSRHGEVDRAMFWHEKAEAYRQGWNAHIAKEVHDYDLTVKEARREANANARRLKEEAEKAAKEAKEAKRAAKVRASMYREYGYIPNK